MVYRVSAVCSVGHISLLPTQHTPSRRPTTDSPLIDFGVTILISNPPSAKESPLGERPTGGMYRPLSSHSVIVEWRHRKSLP